MAGPARGGVRVAALAVILAVICLGGWMTPAVAQLRGQAAADAGADLGGGEAEVDTSKMGIRIIGHNLLLTGGIEHFYDVFQCVALPCLALPWRLPCPSLCLCGRAAPASDSFG